MKHYLRYTLLLLCLLLILSGCGKTESVQTLPPEPTAVPSTAETTAPVETEPERTWRDNVLRKNALDHLGINRGTIVSVTFLDTLADAPADSWDLSATLDRGVLAWEDAPGEIYIAGEGGVSGSGSMQSLFNQCPALRSVTFGGVFHTEEAENFRHLFSRCTSLVSVDVENLDTSSAKDMYGLFEGCESLQELDLSGWDTTSVTDMGNMFAYCYSLQQLNVSSWDTGSVTSMWGLFEFCYSLRQLDVRQWDVSSVTNMSEMFRDCISLEQLDLSQWNTVSVTDMSSMFWGCNSLSEDALLVSPCGNDHNMFYMCYWHDSYFQY